MNKTTSMTQRSILELTPDRLKLLAVELHGKLNENLSGPLTNRSPDRWHGGPLSLSVMG